MSVSQPRTKAAGADDFLVKSLESRLRASLEASRLRREQQALQAASQGADDSDSDEETEAFEAHGTASDKAGNPSLHQSTDGGKQGDPPASNFKYNHDERSNLNANKSLNATQFTDWRKGSGVVSDHAIRQSLGAHSQLPLGTTSHMSQQHRDALETHSTHDLQSELNLQNQGSSEQQQQRDSRLPHEDGNHPQQFEPHHQQAQLSQTQNQEQTILAQRQSQEHSQQQQQLQHQQQQQQQQQQQLQQNVQSPSQALQGEPQQLQHLEQLQQQQLQQQLNLQQFLVQPPQYPQHQLPYPLSTPEGNVPPHAQAAMAQHQLAQVPYLYGISPGINRLPFLATPQMNNLQNIFMRFNNPAGNPQLQKPQEAGTTETPLSQESDTPEGSAPLSQATQRRRKSKPRQATDENASPQNKKSKRPHAAKDEDEALLNKITKPAPRRPLRFTCKYPGCNRQFGWNWSREAHEKTHLGEAGRVFECDICGKGFFTVGCLRCHKKIHLRKRDSFACKAEGCTKTYSTSEGLSLHVRNHHSQNGKPWSCPKSGCTKSFARQADLKLHVIRAHCKEKPFPCTFPNCTKAFACQSELKRHRRSHKTPTQPLPKLQ